VDPPAGFRINSPLEGVRSLEAELFAEFEHRRFLTYFGAYRESRAMGQRARETSAWQLPLRRSTAMPASRQRRRSCPIRLDPRRNEYRTLGLQSLSSVSPSSDPDCEAAFRGTKVNCPSRAHDWGAGG
jgi:hypothetical protein